jgi:carboxylesterase type B
MKAKRRLLATALTVVASLALSLLPMQAQAESSHESSSPVVRTDKGAVRGVRAGGVDSFLGIPYAAPPTGTLRWRPPQPAAPWSGVRLADQYGNRCPAAASTNGPRSETEDCLFVNVQRPAEREGDDRVPVYVFIHGGGLSNGSSNQADMAPIVRLTGVVGVTINYRLGVLGFLGLPGLTAESGESGNYGLMDQEAALRWVQRNIAAFGGDPERVTVGGESAGGWSVCVHLSAPGSRGLMARAMMQSGSCPSQTVTQAYATGASFAGQAGCGASADPVACLRATPVGQLIDVPYPGGVPLPVRGTPFLPLDPHVAVATGQFARVPIVIGANRDEGRTFSQGNIGWTEAQYVSWVQQTFGTNASAVLAHYPWPATSDKFTAAYLTGAIITDSGLIFGIGGCPNRLLTQDFARYTRTFAYEFDHRTGPGLTPIPGYVWGAGHAAELAYLFPSFNNGTPIAPTFNAAERELAREMKKYWGAFVLRGNPRVEGQSPWPSYNTRRQVLSLRADHNSTLISDMELSAEHQCSFWDPILAAHAG